MSTQADPLPTDLATAHAMILAQRDLLAEARAIAAQAQSFKLEIERLKLQLEKARRARFGQSSERGKQIVEQLELAIADLEETRAEIEAKAAIEAVTIPSRAPSSSGTRKPARRPLPEHLPRERIVYPSPCVCGKCGGTRLRKLGEIVTESLECEPRRWKVVEHVRETMTCRDCESVSEAPAPSHPIARGRAGPHLLALVLASKYGQHLPLNRQSEIYAREGAAIEVSTLADWVGACAASLEPIIARIRTHVLAAERVHADCEIASNSDPLKGSFRGQFRPPSDACQCHFLLSSYGLLEGLAGVIGVDLIGQIRRAYFERHRPIKEIVRTLSVSRATVRKVIRGKATALKYERGVQPAPKLGEWIEMLIAILEKEAKLPRRERRSTQRLFEELRGSGYDGAHDSVHRFAKSWRDERARVPAQAFVPMSFPPGDAYQFDWSHETITLRGLPLTIKAAHMKLSHSRMPFVRAYFRETQELVFDAHDKAFVFYGGVCRRGIYDNMKTAVEAIFVGKARQYNRRFLQMCSHYLVEPVACTPASGWEKGQVENQVGTLRDQFFRPKPRVKSLAELNAWLDDQCVAYAKRTQHPEFKDRTIWDVFQAERASLMAMRGPFDGFVEKVVRASTTCLIMADHNRYSVDARAAGQMVLVRSYAERIVVLLGEERVADHPREFRRDQIIYDPWHYLPVLMRKPGALRNGAPFKDWDLPPALAQVRAKLKSHADGDRQFVKVLAAVLDHDLTAVEAACAEAMAAGIASGDVILAVLARQRQPTPPPSITTPDALRLTFEPMADCGRYDSIRKVA